MATQNRAVRFAEANCKARLVNWDASPSAWGWKAKLVSPTPTLVLFRPHAYIHLSA
jgi:hypothetical protein